MTPLVPDAAALAAILARVESLAAVVAIQSEVVDRLRADVVELEQLTAKLWDDNRTLNNAIRGRS